MSVVISVEKVSKAYRLGQIGGGTLKEDVSRWWAKLRGKPDPFLKIGEEHHARKMGELFWALNDVSFQVKAGEVLGVIGRNGAGKSTLLKILSQVTSPTSGQIKIKGRIASLLEVGTGFNPEMTGRENVFLNGAILGMTKAEIRKKFDEIVAFSGVEEFIDTPVKRYSSGMYVRLAFAVAAHLEPEILIVDEVLAVGDSEFQKKCLGKMQDVSTKEGRTVLFVSHNMGAVERLCARGILMQGGELAFSGDVREAITKYLTAFERNTNYDLDQETERSGNGKVRLRKVVLLSDGIPAVETISGSDVSLEFTYTNPQNLDKIQLVFTVYTKEGIAVTHIRNSLTGHTILLSPGQGVITCRLPRLALNQGRYRVAVAIQDEAGESYDHISSALWFNVMGSRFYPTGQMPDASYSLVLTEHDWC